MAWLLAAIAILEIESACPADESARVPVELLIATVSEHKSIILEVKLHFDREVSIYQHEQFGLEEQLGGYLRVFLESDDVSIEFASFSPKTKYPSKDHVREMKAGQSINEGWILSPDSTFYYKTPSGPLEELPRGTYIVTASYTVPDDEISSRVGLDAIAATAVPIQLVVE
jgi:hypothetical protein